MINLFIFCTEVIIEHLLDPTISIGGCDLLRVAIRVRHKIKIC